MEDRRHDLAGRGDASALLAAFDVEHHDVLDRAVVVVDDNLADIRKEQVVVAGVEFVLPEWSELPRAICAERPDTRVTAVERDNDPTRNVNKRGFTIVPRPRPKGVKLLWSPESATETRWT